jgi:hypothetical protein
MGTEAVGAAASPDGGTGAVTAAGVDATTGATLVSPAVTYTASGRAYSTTQPAAAGLAVQLVDKNVGGDVVLATGQTAAEGRYSLSAALTLQALAARHKSAPDLQAQVLVNGTVAASSTVAYNAPVSVTLDIALPASVALPSEFETLGAAIGALYTGPLTELQENGQRQDITYLANKSGWDARAVAMASMAATLSESAAAVLQPRGAVATGAPGTVAAAPPAPVLPSPVRLEPALTPACFYALFRAGLPTTQDKLYRTSAGLVEAAWQKAAAQGIVPASIGEQSAQLKEAFLRVAATTALSAPPLAGPSTLGELLQVALGTDATKQQTFANLLVRAQGNTEALWAEADREFGAATAGQLRLLGQLAYLTVNHAPLLEALYAAHPGTAITSPLDLVTLGYYEAAAWAPLLADLTPPEEVPGATLADQRAKYAEMLAAHVRVSFPTATVAQLAEKGGLGASVRSSGAGQWLMANQAAFDIGDEPLSQFLSRTGTSAPADVVAQVQAVQRVYQVTPDTTTLGVLLSAGITSAYAITQLGQTAFVESYSSALGGTATAESIYSRAMSINAATTHVALSYLAAKAAPSLGSSSFGSLVTSFGSKVTSFGSKVVTQPTAAQAMLEALFGNLDYCQCSDCMSITSPAAYLVDLLDYTNNTAPSAGFQNPQSVLLGRRPDIAALQLTCENTNTALPYLDLVNETLEYYVGNPAPNSESLAGFKGYNNDGTVSSAELVAAPQNDANPVAQNAYDILRSQWSPAPLPFYRDLELLRCHMTSLGVSLYSVMAALRTTEDLETPNPAQPSAYGWRDVLAERLGLSRLEYRLLTDSSISLAAIYGLPSSTSDSAAIASISVLQEYSRLTGTSYSDVVSLLQTRFVNPASALVPALQALNLPFSTVQGWENGTINAAQLQGQLPPHLDTTPYGPGGPGAWLKANYAAIASLVVIDVGGTPCDTTKMVLQHFDGSALEDVDFLRLARFTRLWQKLGLSVQQTDEMTSTLLAASPTATTPAQLDQEFLTLLPLVGLAYLASDLLALGPGNITSLLSCWGPIPTDGAGSLYAQMFLNPTVLAIDTVFQPSPSGELFTQIPAPLLLDHQMAICAALNLTSAELMLITGTTTVGGLTLGLGYDSTTELSVAALTAIYQRAWLARALQLSVLEALAMSEATGTDPFNLPVLDDVHPVSAPLVVLAQRAQAMSNAGLAPVEALYLLWGTDLSGVSSPPPDLVAGLASSLRAAFLAIDSQYRVSGTLTAPAAQSLMAQVMGNTAATLYFGLLNQTFMTSTPFGYTESTLPPAVLSAGQGHLSYDNLAKTLSFTGYLDPATYSALQGAASGDASLTAGLAALQGANAAAVNGFFATYDSPALNLKGLFATYSTEAATDATRALADLLNNLLPVLGNLRKQQQALACATTAAGSGPSFAPALLQDAGVIPASDPAHPPGTAALADLTGIGSGGLSVAHFLTDNPAAPPDQQVENQPNLTYGPSNPLPAPSGGATTIAAQWTGYISAPQDGDYDFSFSADATSSVQLEVGGQAVAMAQSGNTWSNQSAVSLTANALVPVTITATGLSSTFSASWASLGTGWEPLPASDLYPAAPFGYMEATFLRFLKATSLASDLGLSAGEMAYLAALPALAMGGRSWLGSLPTTGPASSAQYAGFTAVLDAALAFVGLKTAYPPRNSQSPTLLQALQDIASTPATGTAELCSVTGWDAASLAGLLPRLFNGATSLSSLPGLLGALVRLQQAFGLVKTTQLSAATLVEAATNDPTPVSDPSSTVVVDFQSAVRSRYAESDWLTVVAPINDTVREVQRDALVAYILTQSGNQILAAIGISPGPDRVCTEEDLYNYFLLDVEMQPCMQTSRVRLALSSVQLFIERCLRNLEPQVAPGDIDGSEWDWRKRYRVWQANREVFLWPENWLDPSLRDDQSPFFQTTMKQLLQSDISSDDAVSAYLGYLSNLEVVAKLEPCGMWYQPAVTGSSADVAHVIARTASTHRKYFYRRLSNGTWSAWEEINLPIEGIPVIPYVWNGRLLLFWLQVHHRPAGAPGQNLPRDGTKTLASSTLTELRSAVKRTAAAATADSVGVVLCFSEYYNGGWQAVKTSDVSNPLTLCSFGNNQFDRSGLSIRPWMAADPSDDSLYMQVTTQSELPTTVWGQPDDGQGTHWGQVSGFVLHNTNSAPVQWKDIAAVPLMEPGTANQVSGSTDNYLEADYYDVSASSLTGTPTCVQILQGKLPQWVVQAQPDVADQSVQPFFWGDARRAFYVTQGQELEWFPRYNGFGVSGYGVNVATLNNAGRYAKVAVNVPLPSPQPVEGSYGPVMSTAAAQEMVGSGTMQVALSGGPAVQFQGKNIGINGSSPALDMGGPARVQQEGQ